MASVKEYLELKRKVENAQQLVDKAKGALEQLIRNLKQDFNCNTIEEAEKKLRSLQAERGNLEQQFDDEVEEFKKKWKDKNEQNET